GCDPRARQRYLRPRAARDRPARARAHISARGVVRANVGAGQSVDRAPRAHPHQPAGRDALSSGRAARRDAPPRGGRAHHRVRRARALSPRARRRPAVRDPEARRLRGPPVRAGSKKLSGSAPPWPFEPTILMLDEPSAGLNRDEREDLARFILRIKHHLGVTMIWIEHDLQMVADLADRIHVLDYGRTLAEGPPTRVLRDPRVVAAYVGTVER